MPLADRSSPTYPTELAIAELAELRKRREVAGGDQTFAPDQWPSDAVGMALSGGGIRSATFCLGVFRALARHRLVRRIDMLSTVSGGGYFGSFLGGLFTPRPKGPGSPAGGPPNIDEVEACLRESRSGPVDWLRENGRYMSPNGSGDTLLGGAIALRNWVALTVVLMTSLVTAFLLLTLVRVSIPPGALPFLLPGELAALVLRSWPSPSATRLWTSPLALVPLGLVVVGLIPLGWAFWFTQRGRAITSLPVLTAAAIAGGALALAYAAGPAGPSRSLYEVVALVALLALAYWAALSTWVLVQNGQDGLERASRNRLSRLFSMVLWATAGLLLLALVDSLGQTVYAVLAGSEGSWVRTIASGLASLGAGFGLAQKASVLLGGKGVRLPFKPLVLATIVAAGLGLVYLTSASAVAHAVAWKGSVPAGDPGQYLRGPRAASSTEATEPSTDSLKLALWLCLAATVTSAWTIPFLNLSSHQSLYGARLTRAYLGASNPVRGAERTSLTDLVPGDQIEMAGYEPQRRGGPLHLINVTLNETVSGKSQIEQRDRKGLGMVFGPTALSVGARHHALWVEGRRGTELATIRLQSDEHPPFEVFPAGKDGTERRFSVDRLDLGGWVSLSGAAFTPGLGSRTSLGLSGLLALANIRLGYWWDSGISPRLRHTAHTGGSLLASVLPVQAYLFDELLARFHGPARQRWYLSDGGHFENTGAYELIRRRLPFIVVCDNGEDHDYQYEDLANLVRKARTDFDAEISFFSDDQLEALHPDIRGYFGVPTFALGDSSAKGRPPHAMLAWIYYDDPERQSAPASLLLVLKPSVSGDEPLDVLNYKEAHPAFPQESTIDQYFDEAQWESYRRLGEHIAQRVFAPRPPGGGWTPHDLKAPEYKPRRREEPVPASGGKPA
jgi:hypothetical protein